MTQSSHLDQLREAVQKELSDEQLRADRCDSFMEQIIRYQNGQGALPDEQQFLLWREDLKKTMAVRALKSAVDLPEEEDTATGAAPFPSPAATSPGRGRNVGRGHGEMDSPAP